MFTITKDHIKVSGENLEGHNGTSLTVDASNGEAFRALCDDGILTFEGFVLDEGWEDVADFCRDVAGCTIITDGDGVHVIS